jgi:hypothetical protein
VEATLKLVHAVLDVPNVFSVHGVQLQTELTLQDVVAARHILSLDLTVILDSPLEMQCFGVALKEA